MLTLSPKKAVLTVPTVQMTATRKRAHLYTSGFTTGQQKHE